MHGIGGTFYFFVGTHPVQTAHENIAEDQTVHASHHQLGRDS